MIGVSVCLVLMWALQVLTPFWWWVMIIPFAHAAWKPDTARRGFFTGMISSGILWLCGAIFYWFQGGGIITARVSEMIGIQLPAIVVALTVIIAMAAGGLGGVTGYYVRTGMAEDR